MQRRTRYKAMREQQLQRCAAAAGAAFGVSDGEPRLTAGWGRQRLANVFAPLLVLAPVLTSAAWYWAG